VVGSSGQVKCWGDDTHAQLGSGSPGTFASSPVLVPGVTGAVAVGVGSMQACALLRDGTVRCWGYNGAAELGNTEVALDAYSGAVAVSGLTDATALSVGAAFACALRSDHTIACWGHNGAAELGDGTLDPRVGPVQVTGIDDATAIGAGLYHACAVVTGHKVMCWGWNADGQGGTATGVTALLVPRRVPHVRGATAVGAGFTHTCAVVTGGAMMCWGANDRGQIGARGTALSSNTPPTAVTRLTRSVASGGGDSQTCALLSTGGVDCWGRNDLGQVANPHAANPQVTPIAVVL
jgi:alpha-tubulin suppressor-like RCC1 family protein